MRTLFTLLLVLGTIAVPRAVLHAQTPDATLNGYVVDSTNNETVVGATLTVRGTKLGAFTNKSGFFVIKDVPAGRQTIVVSSVGYERLEQTVEVAPGASIKLTFSLKPKSLVAQGITVKADRDDEKRQIDISHVNIPVEQLKQLRVGGESDVFRSLQYMPGILTSSQISSGLYIRGGSPDQNLVLLDGSTVYNPSHLLGFFSAFNPDAIKDVDLIKGGFPAEFGGRLSAVLNLTQKDGNRNEFEGLASLGAISSRLTLQGPLGKGSWFVGGRRTYLDLILGLLPQDKDNPLPSFNFYDVNAKVTQDITDNDRVSVSGFYSADNLSLDGNDITFKIGIANGTGSLKWTHIFGDNLFTTLNLSGSRYDNGFSGNQTGFAFEMKNIITDFTAKGSVEWFVSQDATVKAGFESTRYIFDYIKNFTGNKDSTAQSGTVTSAAANLTVRDWAHAGFVQTNYQLTDQLALQLGARVNWSGLSDLTTFDPRVAARYQVNGGLAFKASWGIYHQYLHLASLPDFSFFDTWLPTDSTVQPGRSDHYIFSVETSPFDGYDFNVDFYYKKLYNINEVNQFATDQRNVGDIFYSGNGEAYGAEIFLQKKVGDFTGWLGYALGWINARFDSINQGQEFRPKYDRRHDLKFVGQYKINDRWEVGASFAFQSGQSYTGVTSRFNTELPGESTGSNVTVPAQRYGLRLPPSHQLNINANYNTTLFGLPARLLIDIYNVYSRRDIWFRYYDATKSVTTVTDVRLLPILPTVALEVKF
ncbi:MAG TPA: TonB-dependent receptor [Candidatus Kapabacteria bacterium]|nr:TonB-dependent receptor [Candidatus Kapabacteria bacterium]